jgi:hypothetical protein
MEQDSQRDRPIEITEAMIEAGINALELHEPMQPRIFLAAAVRDVLSSALAIQSQSASLGRNIIDIP